MFVLPLAKGLSYVLSSPELQRVRTRARLVVFGSLAAFLLFILWVPMPLRTHAEGVVWVPENAEVRAAADGFVERLLVRPDAVVSAGDLLLSTAIRHSAPPSSWAARACVSSRSSTPR
jgi:putative peptide zinc metalloprotease protein